MVPTPRNANEKGAMKQIGIPALDAGCVSVGGMQWRLESMLMVNPAGLDTHANSASRIRKEDWNNITDKVTGADVAARIRKEAGRPNREGGGKEAPCRKAETMGPRAYTPGHGHQTVNSSHIRMILEESESK